MQIKGNTITDNGVTKQQLTIPSGVTLNLPYAAFTFTYTDGDGVSHTVEIPAGVNTVEDDGSIIAQCFNGNNPMKADAVATDDYCTTKVVLCENVELVVLGDLMIAGQLDGGNASRKYSGQTSGYHARLVLEKGSKVIVCGEMHVPGFIVDGKTGAGTVTVENGGTLYQPMVIRDFKGGSFTSQVYAQIEMYKIGLGGAPLTPFNEIAFMNVESKVTIKYGGNVKNYGNLHANSAVNSTIGYMVGSNSAAFVQLYENAYMEFDYDPSTNIIDLHIYGGARTNRFEVSVVFGGDDYTCSSDDFIFPISWMYNITLDVIPGTSSATYSMPSMFKLMPGSKMTIAQGAKLTVKELTVYSSFVDGNTVSTKYPQNYSERDTTLTGALPPAELIVNGSISANKLAGNVWSENANGAQVSAKTVSYSVKEPSGNGSDSTSTSYTLQLLFGSNTAVTHSGSGKVYITENSAWVQANFFDFTVGEGYTITVTDAELIDDPKGNANTSSGTYGEGCVVRIPAGSSVTYNFNDGTWYVAKEDTTLSSYTAYTNELSKKQYTLDDLYSQIDPIILPVANITGTNSLIKSVKIIDGGNGKAIVEFILEKTATASGNPLTKPTVTATASISISGLAKSTTIVNASLVDGTSISKPSDGNNGTYSATHTDTGTIVYAKATISISIQIVENESINIS